MIEKTHLVPSPPELPAMKESKDTSDNHEYVEGDTGDLSWAHFGLVGHCG
jgi:hypothetical protein